MTQDFSSKIRIGIDATNIRIGGGITHLLEFLSAIDDQQMQVDQIIVWSNDRTLQALPERKWLIKVCPPALNEGLLRRIGWQLFSLSKAVSQAQCDVLLVPGGSYLGSFHPVVTMSQNLFPFEWHAIRANGFSLRSLKFILLRWVQSYSFRHSDGVIFLTQYARAAVLKVTGALRASSVVIAHGLNPRFDFAPKQQLPIGQYSFDHPYRLIYVSIIDVHKNQLEVILAVEQLRRKGYPVALTLIGPSHPKALARMQAGIQNLGERADPINRWLEYLGPIPYQSLNLEYQKADLGIFASGCETFGMIVLEKMSVGLPIACSNQSAMNEVLGDGGVYFDPKSPSSIADAIETYLLDPQLREQKIQCAHQLAVQYSWARCASETVEFLRQVAHSH